MGNRIVRMAYTDEVTAAARTVLTCRRQASQARLVATTPEAEVALYTSVTAELHKKMLGMPPGVTRQSLAASVREMELRV